MSHYSGSVPDTRRAPNWRDHGACRDQDPELWFTSDATTKGQADTEAAKRICRACPVLATCREWALTTRQKFGVWGALGEKERRNILRQRTRGTRGPRTTTPKPKQTLRSIWNNNAVPLPGGHARWEGPARISVQGRTCTPRQVAFILDRGKPPNGPVLTQCHVPECVLPAHIADTEERSRCGTRAGYQRHLLYGQTPCPECRHANADADNRLRRTGTTKAAA